MQSTSQATNAAANIQPGSIQQKQAALSASRSASRTMEREDWNQRFAAEELIWTAKANRFLMEETAHLTPGSALDMATGEGRNAVWLAEQGWIVRAVDFSDVAIAKARRLAMARNVHEAIDFREADLRTYDLDFHGFDLVAALGDELVIEKACRVERPVETSDGIRVALDCLVRAKRL
jgi:2-polyprenyl-3-methyl-5-hydroxy-6-metoxy-1,4-benzoquinol methylase